MLPCAGRATKRTLMTFQVRLLVILHGRKLRPTRKLMDMPDPSLTLTKKELNYGSFQCANLHK
jgi:hypothetical protein